ncbi:MAG TPA: RNA-binding protein [Candidatus Omnitrophica bacterium]|nr:RNA-binding protein [Candidatus Omnitrophota bacterium]
MNIYVGNLSRDISEQDLKARFAEYGEVLSCRIIKDRFSGQSRGFGFVEMPSQEEAEKAIAGLNGKELGGRSLVVNQARPRQPKRRSGNFRSRRPRGRRIW